MSMYAAILILASLVVLFSMTTIYRIIAHGIVTWLEMFVLLYVFLFMLWCTYDVLTKGLYIT